MNKLFAFLIISLLSVSVLADTLDCQNLYVGRIQVAKGEGLKGVVFINSPNNSSGSYWVWFNGWSESEKSAALSLLMAAKVSQHRVNVTTEEANGCDIQTGQRNAN